MEGGTLFVLVFSAVAIGFLVGRYSRNHFVSNRVQVFGSRHIQGLNYLLNEQPDAAIDTFIDNLEVNQDTLETHLALGNLLRKRGEVARAIKVHQNLLARPSLSQEQSQQVQLELGRDYIKSGLLDRAELLLQELSESLSYPARTQCLEYLADIYQDEREWGKAIDVIARMPGRRFGRIPAQWRLRQSHYYCELAEESLARSDLPEARRLLKLASAADRHSARPSLLTGRLELQAGEHSSAVRALKSVFHQDPAMLPEALPLLESCYRAGGLLDSFRTYLEDLMAQGASWAVGYKMAELILELEGPQAAVTFLSAQMSKEPTLKSVEQLLALEVQTKPAPTSDGRDTLVHAIKGLINSSPRYRCQQCGFGGQRLHWLCPGCKSWNSIKPLE